MVYTTQSQRFVAFLVVGFSIILAALSFLIPVALTVHEPVEAHWRTAAAVLSAALVSGSAVWFLTGLARFKTPLRIAYILLGVGLITYGLATLQLPIIGLFDLWQSEWATGGGVILLFIAGCILMYLAMRQFARTLGLRSRAISFWLVTVASIIFGAIVGFIAYNFAVYKTEGIEIYVGVIAAGIGYACFATLLANKIEHAIGESYQRAVKWQKIALFVFILSSLHEMIGTMLLPSSGNAYLDYGFYLWPFVVTGLVFVRATYEFRLLTAKKDITDQGHLINKISDRDYLDSVTAVARLASRPQEIDLVLDKMRAITAVLPSNAQLSEDDKKTLVQVYDKLEEYLTKNELLRKFTQEEVREQISPGFKAILHARTQDK